MPEFSEKQVEFLNYLSNMLPLVRKHEYVIFNCLMKGLRSVSDIYKICQQEISDVTEEQFNHAIFYIQKSGFVNLKDGNLNLAVETDKEICEYIEDLLNYGLTRFFSENGDNSDFRLWGSYRMDQVQLKLCKNPGYNMKGTYVYNGEVIIFASIKKDASVQEHLNYKDKFLEPNIFQWECEAGLNYNQQQELINSNKALLFIRKVESENGIVLPFTFVGVGKLTNPRKTDNPKGTLLFDIKMENELPDYLQYDFGLNK